MQKSRHHGRHSFDGKNKLCSHKHYHEEKVGRFGRMFRKISPLYNHPAELVKLGAKGGPMDSENSPGFTKTVPLGHIFFGQFIDHDITFDTSSNFTSVNTPEVIENDRTPTLDLDNIFGGGPEQSPYLYQSKDLYLLTGKSNNNYGQGQDEEEHDLMRNSHGTAIIGDPRNDENRVISQMQLAIIRFYNAVYKDVKDSGDYHSSDEIYEKAREITTWHYQWIVVNEFLPKLCGQKIVNDILGKGRKWYHPHEPYIPVEFSVAAYRFGHSMINQNMKLQKNGQEHSIFSPQFGQGFAKITDTDQIVEWEVFFDYDQTYQRAEKLDTKMATDLLELPFVNGSAADKSLATRNLRRGQSFLLPSGESLASYMKEEAEHHGFEFDPQIDDVVNHINNSIDGHNIDLSAGTPLWYYILAEAEEIGRVDSSSGSTPGEGLGPLGATIVAEVLIGLLELDDHSYLGSNRDWTPHLGSNHHFTMKDLMEKAETAVDL